jgi:signal transduction histidine kinase
MTYSSDKPKFLAYANRMVAVPMPLNQRLLWVYCAFLSGSLTVFSHITTRHGLHVPETLGVAAANTLWLTTVLSPRRINLDRRVVGTLAFMAALGASINVAFGLDTGQTLRMAVGNAVFPLLLLWLRQLQQPRLQQWAIRNIRDMFSLFFATVTASLLILTIGATPDVYLGGDASLLECLWWAMRNVAYVFIALACIPVVWRIDLLKEMWRDRRDSLIALSLYATAAASIWLVFSYPGYSLTFLPLLPMIAAGMALRVLTCISVTGLAGITASLFCSLPFFDCNYDSVLPMPIALDLLIVSCALTAFYLAFTRDQRDRYSDELEVRTEELVNANLFMNRVQNSMEEGVIVFAPSGVSNAHNRAATKLLGEPEQDTQAAQWFIGLRTLDGGQPPSAFTRGPCPEDEGTYLLARGKESDRKVLAFHVCALDPLSTTPSMLVLVRDITLEHQRTEELRGFAASAAHDLKAPLTGLSGWLELAIGEVSSLPNNHSAVSALSRVERSTHALSGVIDGWLAYSVERRGNLAPQQIVLHDLVTEILPNFVFGNENERPSISVQVEDEVIADASLIRQVLSNLISNSCKYTQPGKAAEITITSRPLDEEWVQIEVSDHGRGIPSQDLKNIFVPFQRGSENTTRDIRGSGLGLALCERIIHRHRGIIQARPNQPHGVTVWFTLPRNPVAVSPERDLQQAI